MEITEKGIGESIDSLPLSLLSISPSVLFEQLRASVVPLHPVWIF
jgi:hypothetical protein